MLIWRKQRVPTSASCCVDLNTLGGESTHWPDLRGFQIRKMQESFSHAHRPRLEPCRVERHPGSREHVVDFATHTRTRAWLACNVRSMATYPAPLQTRGSSGLYPSSGVFGIAGVAKRAPSAPPRIGSEGILLQLRVSLDLRLDTRELE